jgi:hypothetical protein
MPIINCILILILEKVMAIQEKATNICDEP